ncbi:hypothetical protein SODALDRAFT_325784 [Sodiomyces alkalinus F11]|uniref:Uncharacterized protein n=1 Tax=Sodiomyces alkalinus (strain CBS 110278 / VKM F-3762 / F11) TaxID=1314773 RepID=A0A3N2PPT6_SODAK|nr:hypothetical protein SODALDRAFT_325784 [Sodiomyces alkalinus F11]ROT36450.1 hypothetical protein SODALDRAFT_325784 [Sodiomyces alkalinus F11]
MFLHSGASLHGHEFSKRPPAAAGNQNAAHAAHAAHRLRSAFVGVNPPRRPSSPSSDQTASPSRRVSFGPTPSSPLTRAARPCPARPVSFPASFEKQHVVRFQDEPAVVGNNSTTCASPSYATSEEDSLSDHSGTTVSESTVRACKKRRVQRGPSSSSRPRQATSFVLAYPPPTLRTKQRRFVQIRPRLLLQLRQLSPDKRPKPAIDVLATCVIAGTHAVPRLVRHVPAMVRALRGSSLGRDDLVIAKSEDYDAPSYGKDDTTSEKDLEKREWVAVVSPLSPLFPLFPLAPSSRDQGRNESVDRAEIVLADGAAWTAKTLPNGSYEFVHVDDAAGRTRTARWVKRSAKAGRTAATAGGAVSPAPDAESRFTFSMIDPGSRRHPILATLTPSHLEVMRSYKPPLRSAAAPPSSPGFRGDDDDDAAVGSPPSRRSLPVDEATRNLIMATSVWVSLHAGHGWPAQAPKPPIPLPVGSGVGGHRSSDRQEPAPVVDRCDDVSVSHVDYNEYHPPASALYGSGLHATAPGQAGRQQVRNGNGQRRSGKHGPTGGVGRFERLVGGGGRWGRETEYV